MTTDPPTPGRTRRTIAGSAVALEVSHMGTVMEAEIIGEASMDDVSRLVGSISQVRSENPGSTLRLAAEHPTDALDPVPEAVADSLGLGARRDLLVLGRDLPLPATPRDPSTSTSPVRIRPFAPDDAAAWIRVNNRAFAAHPDQGRESQATLAARCAEDWFDANDFLVADDAQRPGELAGFCWTKRHPPVDAEPGRGEIYVIGVDPSHHGEGLGRVLVRAGLDHLASLGLRSALLYVEADNAPARRLYDSLGFVAERRRRVYSLGGPDDR